MKIVSFPKNDKKFLLKKEEEKNVNKKRLKRKLNILLEKPCLQ